LISTPPVTASHRYSRNGPSTHVRRSRHTIQACSDLSRRRWPTRSMSIGDSSDLWDVEYSPSGSIDFILFVSYDASSMIQACGCIPPGGLTHDPTTLGHAGLCCS